VSHTERAVDELLKIFRRAPDRRSAHEHSRAVLESLAAEPKFITETLSAYLSRPGVLNAGNYPVVAMDVETNPYFVLVANAWIPTPDKRSDLSTKAIHHHGSMLLSTVNVFGPGYEHWLFTRPESLDEKLYRMRVVSKKAHAPRTVAFVDAWVPHLPVYPTALTITLALWSSDRNVSWLDRAKRLPFVRGNEKKLRHVAVSLGLKRALDLKVVENFDYHPTEGGFRNIEDRIEFALGPKEDHLHSVFHVLQNTNNEPLASLVEAQLDELVAAGTARELLAEMKAGRTIEGRLSEGHFTVPFANFSTQDIEHAVAMTADH
jgi:hypothetical protein